MKNICVLSLLLTVASTAFCMHTKLTTAKKYNRTYILSSKSFDPEKSRREAYQKYCPIQINWDQQNTQQTPKMELKPDTSKKNDYGYWNQYTEK